MNVKQLLVVVILTTSTITIAIPVNSKHEKYEGYSVYSVKIKNLADLEVLHQLKESLELDVWQHGVPELRDAVVMVSPENRVPFLYELDFYELTHFMVISDLAKNLELNEKELNEWIRSRTERLAPFENYPRYNEVMAYIENIAEAYPELATLVSAGQSYEGRDIKYLKISTTNFTDTSKPIYFMDAMIHAREWVTTPVALYTIHRLVEDLRDEDRDLLEDVDWIVLPIVNPDGYEYTHTTDRLWRKTRSINGNETEDCWGVDGNRNFDHNFATMGVSLNPCAITFPGLQAFSEVETQFVRNIMFEHLSRIELYLNIHSYGNLVLFAYGNGSLPDNAMQVHHMGSTMGAAFDTYKLPQALYYVVGNSAGVLYGSSGTARDYGQFVGIPFSFTLELPGYDYFFEVPPQYINHINEETWRGIAASARLARTYHRARLNQTNTNY